MLNILCIIQTPVASTEISIIRPFSYLQKQQKITWKLIKEAAFKPEQLSQVDIVVFNRNCHPIGFVILEAVKKAQIPFIYEIDDNYFELPADLPFAKYVRNPRVTKMIEYYLTTATIVKIGSPELLKMVSKYTTKTIYHPYAVDLSLLEGIRPIPKNNFTIGYAGAIHHSRDFEFVIHPILRIAKEFPDIHWDFIGCQPECLTQLSNHHHTSFIPSYTAFFQELYRRNWQIGLSPILDLPHNRSKTDNKLREYGACHIAGIYSNIPPYANNVRPNETGLLADNTNEAWYQAIKTLITQEKLRQKIALQARHWVEQQRSIPAIADLWLGLFNQIKKK